MRPIKTFRAQTWRELVPLLVQLLDNGFTLQESVRFMQQLLPQYREGLRFLEVALSEGELFYQIMVRLGLGGNYCTQLQLAEVHGDLTGTLRSIGKQLQQSEQQRQALLKVLAYPLFLFLFLVGVLLFMQVFLVEQLVSLTGTMDKVNLGIQMVQHGPQYLAILGVILFVLWGLLRMLLRRQSALAQRRFYSRIPLVGGFLKRYYTAFFAHEWGKLLQQGLELRQVLTVMGEVGSSPFLAEIAQELLKSLEAGEAVTVRIASWSFFQPEFSLLIQQGEMTGRLGEELIFYSQRLLGQVELRLEKVMRWLQPGIFLLIAVLVVLIYSGMLLPIYQNMEELL